MISKDEMMALVRSVAVPQDVEHGMGHAFDLGVDWAVEQAARVIMFEVDQPQAANAIAAIRRQLNGDTTS
jgi:CTP:molybdopterin cytidylyltransferase MocA